MQGRLVLPGLPQRNLPQVSATVTALSPRAETDADGNPVVYAGTAAIEGKDLVELLSAAGLDRLTEDMPVQLILEVRKTTFAAYLLAPFAAAFANALQD